MSLSICKLDRIGTYPVTLETSRYAPLLDWSWHRLMPVMSYCNLHHAPCSVVMLAAAIKGSR